MGVIFDDRETPRQHQKDTDLDNINSLKEAMAKNIQETENLRNPASSDMPSAEVDPTKEEPIIFLDQWRKQFLSIPN